MQSKNRVTIFSNGIADFRRVYPIEAGKSRQLAIPVKKDHIGDILASLNVYGPIKLKRPPHYTPVNEISGRLQIDPQNVYQDVGRKLVGGNVSINEGDSPITGSLVGLNVTESATGGEAVNSYAFVVMTDDGKMKTIPFSQVQTLVFTDESIQSELRKALQRKIESLKPESTTVKLEVESEGGGDCIVHYTVPAAAWKMTYRLRDTGTGLFFDGFAIIDNNTEEDWKDFQIAVVTGEPITFSTDLAQSKIPQRSQINVVDDQAQGAVEAERGYVPRSLRRMTKSAAPAAMMASCADDSLQQMASGEANLDTYYTEEGMEANTEVKEIGDFSIFESKTPISIGAGESTTIPVFNVALKDATTTLFFKGENHPERPFRAISFKNETDHSLGRGVCTIYEKGTYAGSCILPACKSGERRMLPHALETGVRVRTERIPQQYAVTAIKISNGTAVSQRQQTCRTIYQIENSKDESFELVLDHNRLAVGCDKKATLQIGDEKQAIEPIESLKMGYRYTVALPANQTAILVIDERQVVDQTIALEGSQGWGWIVNNIILSDLDITDDTIQNCIKAQEALDAKRQELANLDSTTQVAEQEQNRLIGLIQADNENASYRTRLGETEEEVRKATRETIPALNEEVEKLTQVLYDALSKVALDWSPQG
jgi:hypothetical protein